MENKANPIEIDYPNFIRREVTGSGCEEEAFYDEDRTLISTHVYLTELDRPQPKDYRMIKTMLIRDLRKTRSCVFNPVPKNLPEEIRSYMLNRTQIHAEGCCIEFIQLLVFSEDRDVSNWYMCSEDGQFFLGDNNFLVPKIKEHV